MNNINKLRNKKRKRKRNESRCKCKLRSKEEDQVPNNNKRINNKAEKIASQHQTVISKDLTDKIQQLNLLNQVQFQDKDIIQIARINPTRMAYKKKDTIRLDATTT